MFVKQQMVVKKQMIVKKLCVSLVSASLIVLPVERAQASDAAAILGGLIVGGIIANEVSKNKRRRTTTRRTTTRRSSISSAQREQNRQVQTSLNYFGYNVGTVDGSLGRKSRRGISNYQAQMGFPVDGRLEPYERDFLLTSYQRALASSHVPPYNTIVATQGHAGLLRTYRNEQLGIATPGVATPGVATAGVATAAAPAPVPVPVPAPVPTPAPVPVAAPQPAAVAPTGIQSQPTRAETGALPNFTFGQVAKSISEHCNQINVLTAANGGLTTGSRVTDPEFALNEQFCLARTHAMAESSRIVATIPNMTSQQIEAQCTGLAQVITPHMETLSTARADVLTGNTRNFLQGAGQPMDQLMSGGKVCLGVGYRTDNANVALASAVLLASGGQLGYAEMVSHHMREGFGTARVAPAKAGEWMAMALQAMQGGGTPVLGQSLDRMAVLSVASNGGAQAGTASALPVFTPTSGN